MIVQVAGCREDDGEVTPFVADEDAEFWSVYLGEPGGFKCLEDFDTKVEALGYAFRLIGNGRAQVLQNRTFSKGDYNAK